MTDLLIIGAGAARAYGAALRTVGENVANADDPAYVRRTLALREAGSAGAASPLYAARVNADGVSIGGVVRGADPLLDAAQRSSASDLGRASVRSDWLGRLEESLGDGPQGVGTRISAVFNAATRLAASPDSAERRIDMLGTIGAVADGFGDTATRIAGLQGDAAAALTNAVPALNRELAGLADINIRLRGAAPGSAGQAHLLDRRDASLASLAELMPIDVQFGAQGIATVRAGGATLVDGITAANVTAISTVGSAVGSAAQLAIAGSATPAIISGGALGGLATAATSIDAAAAQLDTLASDFAATLNSWQADGRTMTGAAGPALLSGTSAATLAVLTTDPAAIAAADSAGQANGNLNAFGALRTPTGSEAGWTSLVHTLGQQVSVARADTDASQSIADYAAARRDSLSGVDLDREATEMLRLQQAYDAAARILQVARETMQSILAIF